MDEDFIRDASEAIRNALEAELNVDGDDIAVTTSDSGEWPHTADIPSNKAVSAEKISTLSNGVSVEVNGSEFTVVLGEVEGRFWSFRVD